MHKEVIVAFEDFWKSFDIYDNFIVSSLKKKYDVKIIDVKNHPDQKKEVQYLFYADFSNNHLEYSCIRIYFTGENLIPNFNSCDYAMGFEYISLGDRYLRYPLYLACFQDDMELALKKHQGITNDYAKRKFCAMVVSNWWHCSDERENFFKLLSEYKVVDSGGRYLNNINQPNGVEDKNKFQIEYKFSLCFENSSSEGYCTEKLMQSFSAKTVPIYWGDPSVVNQFNPKAFINCNSFSSFDEAVKYIIEIDKDDERYLSMLKEPAISFDFVNQKKSELDNWLYSIFNQDYATAFRRKLYGLNLQIEDTFRKNSCYELKYKELVSSKKKLLKAFVKLLPFFTFVNKLRCRIFKR